MQQQLLERDSELAALGKALDRAPAGQGSVAVILGEAGIGKTSVLRSFIAQADHRARVLSGDCDDLMTPRTLGAIRDAAGAVDGPLATALAAGDRDDLLAASGRNYPTARDRRCSSSRTCTGPTARCHSSGGGGIVRLAR
jgi:predicted ATPase